MCQNNVEIIKGAKILSLYKQHYLDMYTQGQKFECEYSCWGYFDGMRITSVQTGKSALFEKISNSYVSDIWYQKAQLVQKQQGISSEQHIGIFRCIDDDCMEAGFWENRKAFLAACFVQLDNSKNKNESRDAIEKLADENVDILTYYTFDNADMIMFLQSRSIVSIRKKISQISQDLNVVYVHSIFGILEEVLKKWPENKLRNYVVNDCIKELRLEIIGNSGNFEGKLKSLLSSQNDIYPLKGYDVSEKIYSTATGSYSYSIRDTDIYSMLSLFVPDSVLTHTNGIFGNGLYNIQTNIVFEYEEFLKEKDLSGGVLENDVEKNTRTSWCKEQIKKYREYMISAWEKNDEGLYAYYQSMIHTLNALVQFEEFSLANNIFYLVYPALEHFGNHLENAINKQTGINKSDQREETMTSMLNFLDAVNSIIYHAIHMDQVFLMIPGCSGTSFSIPTKLSMFYLWYLETVSDVLNDSKHQYGFYLTPVIESKPYTYLAEFGLSVGNRLVCVKLSQRTLYMPRALLMILTHETAHYVGDDIRERKSRLKNIIRTIGYMLGEAIVPYWFIKNQNEAFKSYFKVKKENIIIFAIKRLGKYVRSVYEANPDETLYHVSKIKTILCIACAEFLLDENGELEKIIRNIPEALTENKSDFSNVINDITLFDAKTKECDERRTAYLAEGIFDGFIDVLLKEYQEIFADAAAIVLGEFSKDDYDMCFSVSEGCIVKDSMILQKDYNRKRIISEIFFEQVSMPKTVGILNAEEQKNLIDYWSYLDVVSENMKAYVELCKKSLETQIVNKEENIGAIRQARKLFTEKKYTFKNIFEFIDEKSHKYATDVEKQIRES